MKRIIIPYNPKLKELARKLRRRMTFSEVKLWNELKQGKLLNYDFNRQHPVWNYIVDFYCKDLYLAIEIDGITHTQESVAAKDIALGVKFLRFEALLVVNKVEAVVREIENWIKEYEAKHGVPLLLHRRRDKRKASGRA